MRTLNSLNVDQMSDAVLPVDGPHDPERVVAAAGLLAELVRRLNHATRRFTDPVTIYDVVGRVAAAEASLPQLLNQLASSLSRIADDPALASDDPQQHPATLAYAAADQLGKAADVAARVAARLQDAHGCTSHLYERG